MTVRERIEKLQELMKKQDIQIYIVPTADYHQSEYVGEHFKARKYLTGFTGSAGTAVVLQDRDLSVDGRKIFHTGGRADRGNDGRVDEDG